MESSQETRVPGLEPTLIGFSDDSLKELELRISVLQVFTLMMCENLSVSHSEQ